jgi:hypothetical protein
MVLEENLLIGFRILSSASGDVEIRGLLTPIVGHPGLLPITDRNRVLHMSFVFIRVDIKRDEVTGG